MKGIADRFRISNQSAARSHFGEPDTLPDEQSEMTALRAARAQLEQTAQRGKGLVKTCQSPRFEGLKLT